jgi:hypothetical protein
LWGGCCCDGVDFGVVVVGGGCGRRWRLVRRPWWEAGGFGGGVWYLGGWHVNDDVAVFLLLLFCVY